VGIDAKKKVPPSPGGEERERRQNKRRLEATILRGGTTGNDYGERRIQKKQRREMKREMKGKKESFNRGTLNKKGFNKFS